MTAVLIITIIIIGIFILKFCVENNNLQKEKAAAMAKINCLTISNKTNCELAAERKNKIKKLKSILGEFCDNKKEISKYVMMANPSFGTGIYDAASLHKKEYVLSKIEEIYEKSKREMEK